MRIVYCGSLGRGATCQMRMRVLEEFGHDIVPINTDQYYRMYNRIVSAIFWRLQWGPNFWNLNRDLVTRAELSNPHMIWIDKGVRIYPETLRAIKQKNPRLVLTHYAGDPLIRYHQSKAFFGSIPLYDILFTTKEYELEDYARLRARNVKLVGTAYSRYDHRPVDLTKDDMERFGNDVSFIGHCEPWYVEELSPLLELNVRFGVQGFGWYKARTFRRVYRGEGVYGEDYAKAIGASKISIGLLTKLAPDQITTRSLEIPACGTFMLAERTTKHLEYFEEGKEAEFFGSKEELLDKCRYYLTHEGERQRIAAAGRKRCLTSGYSYHDRMRQMMEEVVRVMGRSL